MSSASSWGPGPPRGWRPVVRPRLGLLSAQPGPGDPTPLPRNPWFFAAAPRFPPNNSFPPLLGLLRDLSWHLSVIPAAPVIPGTLPCTPKTLGPPSWPLVILAAPRSSKGFRNLPETLRSSPPVLGPTRNSSRPLGTTRWLSVLPVGRQSSPERRSYPGGPLLPHATPCLSLAFQPSVSASRDPGPPMASLFPTGGGRSHLSRPGEDPLWQ